MPALEPAARPRAPCAGGLCAGGGAAARGGARASLYLVFQATELYAEKYGQGALQADMLQAFFEYAQWKMPSFKAERSFGAEAALGVWRRTVANECDPAVAYVVSLWADKAAQAAAELPSASARL